MMTRQRFRLGRFAVDVALSIILCLVLLYLGEYLGVRWIREAGGGSAGAWLISIA